MGSGRGRHRLGNYREISPGTLLKPTATMTQRISPSYLQGYDVICTDMGRIERNELGRKNNIPDPILTKCARSDGLCWWVKPIGFSFSITLKVTSVSNFWKGCPVEQG